MIILSGSPRRGGNSDTAATILQQGLAMSGVEATIRTVRDGVYRPCIACGFCERHPGRCTLDTPGDDTARLLAELRGASALLLVLPVFFYGPPAQCKALMDRAQTFWWLGREAAAPPPRPLFMTHIAGRREGARLFEANGLIGRCFGRTLGFAPLPEAVPETAAETTPETVPEPVEKERAMAMEHTSPNRSQKISPPHPAVPPPALHLPGLDGPTALRDDNALCERVRAYGQAMGAVLVRRS